MKTIGIKLADGSFYPIMEEGQPCKKTLGLTTVKDNQTRIVVDLYRSRTNSMDDAEYVDTLQIDGLVAHPNGEADISLNIGLDENNELTADMNDPETGEASSCEITLVSRTLEQRLEPTNYEITEDVHDTIDGVKFPPEENSLKEESAMDEVEKTESNENKAKTAAGVAGGVAAAGGLLAAATLMKKKSEEEAARKAEQEPVAEETVAEEPAFEEPAVESIEETGEFNAESAEPAESSGDDFDLPDFNDETAVEEPKAEEPEESFEPGSDDFGFAESSSAIDDAFAADETEVSDDVNLDGLDLPDFSDEEEESNVADENDFYDAVEASETENDASSYVNDNTPSNGINFSGLYDEETVADNSTTEEKEEEEIKKKTKVPVIICIICAIICLIATILILFIVPSKYNLLSKKSDKTEINININSKDSEVEIDEKEPEEIEEPEAEDQDAAEQDVESEEAPAEENADLEEPAEVEAEEDDIVVVAEPEQVAPEPPVEPVVEPKDITYKIKWGDTLWDIADTYYKNPWKYHKIARDNKIRNPDHIISGHKITLKSTTGKQN